MINEFDTKALTWDDNPQFVERSEKIANKIRKQIPLNNRMTGFEYGCGTGLISFNLMPYLKHITLADNSDGMLEVLRNKIQNHAVTTMDVIKTDLITDAIPEKKFDLIFTALTLHHINDVEAIIKRFYTMISKAGFLAVADLDKEDATFHGPEFTGHKGFERHAMKMLFVNAGFKNIKVSTCYVINRMNEHNENTAYPMFLMTGEKL